MSGNGKNPSERDLVGVLQGHEIFTYMSLHAHGVPAAVVCGSNG